MNPLHPTTSGMYYRISIQGHLDAGWADWLNSALVQVEQQAGPIALTSFIASVPDQAALRGLLGRLWNLNLTLVSLQLLDADALSSLLEKPTAQEIHGG